jgi:hypothetical protein
VLSAHHDGSADAIGWNRSRELAVRAAKGDPDRFGHLDVVFANSGVGFAAAPHGICFERGEPRLDQPSHSKLGLSERDLKGSAAGIEVQVL